KKPRNTCVLLVCSHSPPVLIVWRPVTMEKLSFNWNRLTSSSMFGARKNGFPKRNDGTKPMPVSAGTPDGVAERGRFSREYVKWNSFSRLEVTVVNRLAFTRLIFDGPSVPLADAP